MAAIKLETFGGMNPAVDDHLLPPSGAAYAENTWLYEGNLSGFKSPRLVRSLTNSAAQRVFRIPLDPFEKTNLPNSIWLEFTQQYMDVVRAPVIDDSYQRYYWFGATSGGVASTPQYNTLARLTAGSPAFTLGVPAPTVAPGVAAPVLAADTDPPVATSFTVDGTMIVISFNEARRMDALSVPSPKAFVVYVDGINEPYDVSSVSIDELYCKVTLTLVNPVKPNKRIGVNYVPPGSDTALKDNSGNLVVKFSLFVEATANSTVDRQPPVFGWADTSENGKYIWVTFEDDSLLDLTKTPPSAAWFVFVNGVAKNVIDVLKLDGDYPYKMAYRLTVDESLNADDKVTLSYVRPADAYAVADIYGNKASTFANQIVRNNTKVDKQAVAPKLSKIELIGRSITITYDQELDPSYLPAAGRYTITNAYNSAAAQNVIKAVSIDGVGKQVFLQCSADTTYQDDYNLSYNTNTGLTNISDTRVTGKGGYIVGPISNQPITNSNPQPTYYNTNNGDGG